MCTNPHTQITQEFTDFGKLPTSMDSDEEKVSALTGEKNILTIYLIFNSYNGRGDFLFLVNGEIWTLSVFIGNIRRCLLSNFSLMVQKGFGTLLLPHKER